jgi:hypothetical protein
MRAHRFLCLVTFCVTPATPAFGEVFCLASSFDVNGYVYGMPALENIKLANGSTMPNVSLCGTNCTDAATSQRLAVALTAQARGLPLSLYFGSVSSCTAISAYEKAFGVSMLQD